MRPAISPVTFLITAIVPTFDRVLVLPCGADGKKNPKAGTRWPSWTRLEKREVATLLGAENLLCVELGIAAGGTVGDAPRSVGAASQFCVVEEEVDAPLFHR